MLESEKHFQMYTPSLLYEYLNKFRNSFGLRFFRSIVFSDESNKSFCERAQELRKVYIGSEVIPEKAFAYCRKLESVIFSDNVKQISYEAFFNTNIKEVILPRYLEILYEDSFRSFYREHVLCNMTVYDSAPCKGLGRAVISSFQRNNDYTIIIKNAGTGETKGKVFMCGSEEPDKITNMLSSSWKEYAEFEYSNIDTMFEEYKVLWHRAKTARFRLEYPEGLSEENVKKYKDFLSRNGLKIMSKLIDENNVEEIRCFADVGALTKNNIDKVSALAAEKGDTELTAWLLDFKNTHFQGNKK